ncbi:hypothetical protein [Bradyrhizobium sp. cir1]|uniref:hypothetical protein n=1 Tax=Bradyrhizobium sp. cir1 TaxID=1445730 RepID=UPI001AEE2D61|nr:hypothetical protein [Bradyrhizobium sp. cir1]
MTGGAGETNRRRSIDVQARTMWRMRASGSLIFIALVAAIVSSRCWRWRERRLESGAAAYFCISMVAGVD